MKPANAYACTVLFSWFWTTQAWAQQRKPAKDRQQPTGDFVIVEEWNRSDPSKRNYLLLVDPKMAPPVKAKRVTPKQQPPVEPEPTQPLIQFNAEEEAGFYSIFPGRILGRPVNRPPWLWPISIPKKKEQDH